MIVASYPRRFDGSAEQRERNVRSHRFGGIEGRCLFCDTRPAGLSASWGCGDEIPRVVVGTLEVRVRTSLPIEFGRSVAGRWITKNTVYDFREESSSLEGLVGNETLQRFRYRTRVPLPLVPLGDELSTLRRFADTLPDVVELSDMGTVIATKEAGRAG